MAGIATDDLDLRRGPALREHPLYEAFVRCMPLGNRAEDYAVALGSIEAGIEASDQAEWDRIRSRWSGEFLDRFHSRFYRERAVLRETDRAAWLSLVGPYRQFVTILRKNASRVELALATAKDRRSVMILLEAYGIADLFAAGRILDKETGANKCAHLSVLAERLGLEFGQITFVDDKVSHLDCVAVLGVRCALASWGYNGPREYEAAREHGHLVCSLEDVEAQLFAESGAA